MIDNGSLELVAELVAVADFYLHKHKMIYSAMLDLRASRTPIDQRTLQSALEEEGGLDAVGGMAYVVTLDTDLPDITRVQSYATIVRDRSLRRRLMNSSVEIARAAGSAGENTVELIARSEELARGLREESGTVGFRRVEEIVIETLEELEERPGKALQGVATGFVDYDRMTRGMVRKHLVVFGGRPGSGKTSLGLNMAANMAIRGGEPVGIFSMEMSAEELVARLICSEADVPFDFLAQGLLSREQWVATIKASRRCQGSPLFIDDKCGSTVEDIEAKAMKLQRDHGARVIMIDYLGLMESKRRYERRDLEVGAISRRLKALAKELDITVICLAQLSRDPEKRTNKRPQLSDLRESGAIEQDADLVAFTYRAEQYEPENADVRGLAEVIVAKHRNGATGTIQMAFSGATMTFRSLYLPQGQVGG